MTISFDVAQLSGELAALRAHPHAHKIAVVIPVDAESADMTRAAISEGPPFDQHIATGQPRLGVVAYAWSREAGEETP